MNKKVLILCIALAFVVSGCSTPMTNTEKGTAAGVGIGAATGAILGQAIGRNTSSTLLGAAAGAAVGGIAGSMIGSYMDRQEREMQRLVAGREGTTENNLSINMKSDVLFDTGSSLIKPGGNDEIARIAGVLNRYPETRVTVEGHTDSAGSESYNMQLSEQRARAVGEALVGRGVNAARVTTVGLGESRPIASNATEGGKQLNRRVTILVVPIEA